MDIKVVSSESSFEDEDGSVNALLTSRDFFGFEMLLKFGSLDMVVVLTLVGTAWG